MRLEFDALGHGRFLRYLNLFCKSVLDQLGTDPDKDLPATLRSKIGNSTLCVLVGTQQALSSEAVRKELEEFKKTKRTIVPIYFDSTPDETLLYSIIPGLVRSLETKDALLKGDPSSSIISRIEKSFNYTRRNERMRRLALGTVAAVILLLGGTIGLSTVILRRAQNEATAAQNLANERLFRATKAEDDANAAKKEAQEALERARMNIAQADYNAMRAARAERCCPKCR